MTQRFYDPAHRRLVYVNEGASPEFWDHHWRNAVDTERASKGASAQECVKVVREFAGPPKGAILEAGCGSGGPLLALHRLGYDVTGLDFAAETIKGLNESYPELKAIKGDVRRLEFADDSFDAYYSGGVIEHFWDGYEPIVRECHRVLKPGGFGFFTFPSMSPLRAVKARLGAYAALENPVDEPEKFYQFALPALSVVTALRACGFEILRVRARNGTKGVADEAPALASLLNIQTHLAAKVARRITSYLAPWCGHSTLIVARKAGPSPA